MTHWWSEILKVLFHITSVRFNMIAKMELQVYQTKSALNSDNFIGFQYCHTVFMQCYLDSNMKWQTVVTIPPRGLRQQAIFEVLNNVDTTRLQSHHVPMK